MSSTDPFGLIGQVLDGQFRVDKFVGEGGFSVVYRGHHVGLEEPIAIKCLKLPVALGSALVESFVRRFRDESRIHYKLSQGNLNIARTLAHGTTMAPLTGALVPYMVLEWLEGRGLGAELEVRRAYGDTGRAIRDVITILDPAADGLAYAHANGVVHRDVNPGNLFLAKTPLGIRLKVLDFGVAKVVAENALALGPRVNTIGQIRIFSPQYAAPEQFDDNVGPIGPWTDVYSFALITIEMLRDRPAVEGEHLGDFAARALDPRARPSPRRLGVALPDLTEKVLASAVSLKPADRPQDLGELWGALKNAVQRDAAEGNVAFAEPPPRSDMASSPGLSSATDPKINVPPLTTLSLEKVPLPIRPTGASSSANIPDTPTQDVPRELHDGYLAEPPTRVEPMPAEMPPETARMTDAPAHEEAPPRPPVNSGAGALAAAFSNRPLLRRSSAPPATDPRALGSTKPSAGIEARPHTRPPAPEFVGADSRAPPTPAATEVKIHAPPAPIPNVFEGRRGAPAALDAMPVTSPAPSPVPVAPTLGPQLTTGPMTVVAVPPPAVPPELAQLAQAPPRPAPTPPLRVPAPSNTPPAVPPAPSHAASQPPPLAPPRKEGGLAVVVTVSILLVLSAAAYLLYAVYRARHG